MSAKNPQFVRRSTLPQSPRRQRSSILGSFLLGSVMVAGGCTGSVGNSTGADDSSLSFPPDESPVNACSQPRSVGLGQWRRLTTTQYLNSVRDLLGQEADVSGLVADN